MAYPLTPHSPVTILATMNRVLNAIILAIFVSTANGTSARFAKSTILATPNAVALWVVLILAPRRPPPHPLPNLVPFLPLALAGWSQRTLASVVATPALVPLLALTPPSKILITTSSLLPT